jgi:chemotaxis response regulator CheB
MPAPRTFSGIDGSSLSLLFLEDIPILRVTRGTFMDRAIRILVANRPKLMRELILSTLADEPGIEVVGEVSDEAEIRERVRQALPDLLVIALDEPTKRPVICDTLLRDHPGLRIIAVASQENCSVFYWASFDIHASQIEASEQGILNAVRNITPAGAGELCDARNE